MGEKFAANSWSSRRRRLVGFEVLSLVMSHKMAQLLETCPTQTLLQQISANKSGNDSDSATASTLIGATMTGAPTTGAFTHSVALTGVDAQTIGTRDFLSYCGAK
jgi:hypothetical protein